MQIFKNFPGGHAPGTPYRVVFVTQAKLLKLTLSKKTTQIVPLKTAAYMSVPP